MRAEALSTYQKQRQRQGWSRSRFSLQPQEDALVVISGLKPHHRGLLKFPLRKGPLWAAVEAIAAGIYPDTEAGRALKRVLGKSPDALVKTLRRHPHLLNEAHKS